VRGDRIMVRLLGWIASEYHMDCRLDRVIFAMDDPDGWISQQIRQECCGGWLMIWV
jgi:hypothetical protein